MYKAIASAIAFQYTQRGKPNISNFSTTQMRDIKIILDPSFPFLSLSTLQHEQSSDTSSNTNASTSNKLATSTSTRARRTGRSRPRLGSRRRRSSGPTGRLRNLNTIAQTRRRAATDGSSDSGSSGSASRTPSPGRPRRIRAPWAVGPPAPRAGRAVLAAPPAGPGAGGPRAGAPRAVAAVRRVRGTAERSPCACSYATPAAVAAGLRCEGRAGARVVG